MITPYFRILPVYLIFITSALGAVSRNIDDLRVFAVYEPVFTQQDVEILSRVHPDFVCRGWFKWHNTPDWRQYTPMARICHKRNILIQGGITMAALYRGENGIDETTFRDYACDGTDGQPYLCRTSDDGGWYHLSLYNPKVVDYIKQQVHLQIDAGAVGIWYDEIEGYYDWNPTEGYDSYACTAFREWLIKKYCDGQNWREDDPRWKNNFNIDLSKYKGSIRNFDYLHHLRTTIGQNGRPLADNPPQIHPRKWESSPNMLFREWGFAWDRRAKGTFRFDTVAEIFNDILADADRYALEKYHRTLISTYNHNGTARPGAAFLQPHNGAQPPMHHGRLNARISYLSYYEKLIADAAEVCPDQPVVFFIDWPTETDRFTALPRTDQIHFLATYIPEAYAAGGEFALPLRGYSYVSLNQRTLAFLSRMAGFIRAYSPWLRGSQAVPQQPEVPPLLSARARSTSCGTALHLVNHAFSTREIQPQICTNLTLSLDWDAPAPVTAFAVSPDYPEQHPVSFSLENRRLHLTIDTLNHSALVLLPASGSGRLVSGTAPDGTHILDPAGHALTIAHKNRFSIWLTQETADLECLETGEVLPVRESMHFAPPTDIDFAGGLLLDSFGIPLRHTEITSGSQRWETDDWGRFHLPLSRKANRQLSIHVENAINTLSLQPGFTAWQISADSDSVGDFTSSLDGFWANWPDKDNTPEAINLQHSEYLDKPAMQCTFLPRKNATWSNVNSPGFEIGGADTVELSYAGDGTDRQIHAVLHDTQARSQAKFYRIPLSLKPTQWTTCRFTLDSFRNDEERPFDPATAKRVISFQLAPGNIGDTPATCRLHSVRLLNSHPVRQLWHSNDPFDTVDVENLHAETHPLPPPPVPDALQPLVEINKPVANLHANWEGKTATGTDPMVTMEQVTPGDADSFIRVTLPPGECMWGNANIALDIVKFREKDGLAVKLRALPATGMITLSLHAGTGDGHQHFFLADFEVGSEWSELVIPWSDFRDNGEPFNPESAKWVNLQICRPSIELPRMITIDIQQINTFTLKH